MVNYFVHQSNCTKGSPIFKFFKFDKDDENSMERAIRGHSNLIEYSPNF
jgi:hypothetical protein